MKKTCAPNSWILISFDSQTLVFLNYCFFSKSYPIPSQILCGFYSKIKLSTFHVKCMKCVIIIIIIIVLIIIFPFKWLHKTFILNWNPMIWNFIKQLKVFFSLRVATVLRASFWAGWWHFAVIKLEHIGCTYIHLPHMLFGWVHWYG